MRLKTKLFLGFASILAIMAVFFGISIYSLDRANKSVESNQKERYQKITHSKMVENELNNISRYLRDIALLEIDSHSFAETVQSIRDSREKVKTALDALEASAIRDVTKNLLSQIRTENLNYIELQEDCITLASSDQKEEFDKLINAGAEERRLIFKYVEELNDLEDGALDDLMSSSAAAYNRAIMFFFISLLVTLFAGVGITAWITRRVTDGIQNVTEVMSSFSSIQEHINLPRIGIHSNDEIGEIAASFNDMARSLEEHAMQEKEFIEKIEAQNWLKSGTAEITALCQGVDDLKALTNLLITKIIPMVEASYGVFYIMEEYGETHCLRKYAVYAPSPLGFVGDLFLPGEGLVGQSALENRTIIIDGVPEDYIKISSGLGHTLPLGLIILPVSFEGEVVAVMELASLQAYSPLQQELLEQVSKNIGITINRIQAQMKIGSLLKESQVLTEELQSQSEELQLQQEELKSFNENLEEQYKQSEKRATELEALKAALEEKARQLEESSNYKTEFLSNMSHELRTPLNSLLILSQMLSENKEGNLTSSQIEYVKTIFSSGNELLALINDILDLSKIEAGKITIEPEVLELADMMRYVEQYFLPVASQKNLDFTVVMSEDLPVTAFTDEQRLLQILKNLLSNAFKFTGSGSVSLQVRRAEDQVIAKNNIFRNAEWVLAFSVTDTGIGISKYKQTMIFEAFQQANGTTARKYGGTGLGLTISQKLARLLGGYIDIESVEGKGSTFTLYLPGKDVRKEILDKSYAEAAVANLDNFLVQGTGSVRPSSVALNKVDEVQKVENGNARLEGKKILVVDDDMRNVFALTTALENQKIKALFAENGREGIEVLEKNWDIDLVLMDIMMPEMDGYEALRRIRQMPKYVNLPIIALTAKAMKNDREKCIEAGASDYISKPVNLEQLFSLIKIWLYR
ncbi:response regulator [Desulfosporosinus lacus]|uniref:Circadian input-output histidine kinase CikA n=1 Tax=Desulfosporosinus lacus DSM 15449 TaxID=1121420 RepID=A0A1M5Z7C5_9FIRM|nr:response regulator [Desulfosporosinus lacus]SHI20130.1 two-component system, chemotaxis family, sensor kinase CheA [Desulfosporosinus lacus DSM 15449]